MNNYLKTENEIKKWLDSMKISNYTINDDLSIDVDGNVYLLGRDLIEIPVQFNVVKGDFLCAKNKLKSLKGSPRIVYGDFICSHNELVDLKFCPSEIHGSLNFDENMVTTLKNGPVIVHKEICCGINPIKNFDGIENISAGHFSHFASKSINCIHNFELYYEKSFDPFKSSDQQDELIFELEFNILKNIIEKQKIYKNLTSELDSKQLERKKIKL